MEYHMQNNERDGFRWRHVQIRDSLVYEQFANDFLNKNTPVVIRNSVPHWSALENWTPAYLKRRLGKRPVVADAGYFAIKNNDGNKLPFDELMKLIEDSTEDAPSPYLRNLDIYSFLPELVEDIQPRLQYALPNWLPCKLMPKIVTDGLVELFVGGRGTGFPNLHIDTHGSNAFISQIYGKKEVVLFAPDQTDLLRGLFGDPHEFSLETLQEFIKQKNPVADLLVGYKQTLSPGDTVFIPAGWWHTTKMNELSITVSTNNVNQSNWKPFVKSLTDYNRGPKKMIKTIYLLCVGGLLRALDLIGQSGLISRSVDKQ